MYIRVIETTFVHGRKIDIIGAHVFTFDKNHLIELVDKRANIIGPVRNIIDNIIAGSVEIKTTIHECFSANADAWKLHEATVENHHDIQLVEIEMVP